MTACPALLADIGGTNARFALSVDGALVEPQILRCADFPSLEAVSAHYLAGLPCDMRPQRAAFSVAGPVLGDEIHLVNRGWTFSQEALRRALGLTSLVTVNDFTAIALALPRLSDADVLKVGGGAKVQGAPMAVLGPGSGLGHSGLLPRPDGGWVALSGEGGHSTMAASDDREAEILRVIRSDLGHVSAERVLSGPGLEALYRAIAQVDQQATPPSRRDHEIMTTGLDGSDAVAVATLDQFCAFLGTAAGNLALTLGASGGTYIAGGIVPRMATTFAESRFRSRFEAKGRLVAYMAAIPTFLVTHPLPAFYGLMTALDN